MSQYHHGNLRNALIIAAAELIEERGSTAFSMIDTSRRAGVSSAAPYRHFKDKDHLLEAVCQVAFMALTESTQTSAAMNTKGTTEHIIALGKAYITFVSQHPQFYDLMWGEHAIRAIDANPAQLKSSGFYVLVESVQIWSQQAGLEDCDPVELATQLWACVHGFSTLALNGHLEKFNASIDVYTLLESSVLTFLAGLEAQA